MSSPAVRTAARALAESVSWPASIPFVETFNVLPDEAALKGTFSTLDFEVESDERLGIGVHEYLERGTIRIVVRSKAGQSFGDLEAAFDALRPVILGHVWPSHITITSVGAPIVAQPGGKGLHVEAEVNARYLYQHAGGT